jgi:hypothetical protein
LGWRPSVSFDQLVQMMVQADIELEESREVTKHEEQILAGNRS